MEGAHLCLDILSCTARDRGRRADDGRGRTTVSLRRSRALSRSAVRSGTGGGAAVERSTDADELSTFLHLLPRRRYERRTRSRMRRGEVEGSEQRARLRPLADDDDIIKLRAPVGSRHFDRPFGRREVRDRSDVRGVGVAHFSNCRT